LKKNSIRQKELKLLSKTPRKLPEQEEAAVTPITVTTTTETALIVEELVNELESFVAYDCPRLYLNIHTQLGASKTQDIPWEL
jgi:hypothetical protein